MKISEQWLREWVNPAISVQELVEQLTMAGLEIESVTPVAGDFTGIIIGKVNKVEPHPNADRLRLCEVDVGQSELLSIVCGAANVRAGLKVPVAVVGAVLSGNRSIQAAKLRGVLSQGMICSAAELELQETSEGIMELPIDAPIGEDFRKWLDLNDHIIDVHLTPNRGDCLSVLGMAREVAVLNNSAISLKPPIFPNSHTSETMPIEVQASNACPRYLGRVIRNINSAAKLPLKISERLRRSGLRCIHPIVDITNYVMLELGQPLHAFDLAKLTGNICVRFAHAEESITLLNGQKTNLDKNTLVIADRNQVQAIAGVMGGLESAVSDTTQDIFLESAFFTPLALAGQARRYGLSTDSAYRFERGVDPELPRVALERVTQLILELTGGKAGPIVEKSTAEHLPKLLAISLRKARIERVLGISITGEKITTILRQLGMEVKENAKDIWSVTPPSHRYDIAIEADLIEEIARVDGYANIPTRQPTIPFTFIPQAETHVAITQLRQLLVERGYREAITYSFTTPKLQKLIDPKHEAIALANPISAELSVMRTSLWPGLLEAVLYNQNRQQSRLRLFETGLRFVPEGKDIRQESILAGVVVGSVCQEQWSLPQRPVDFFDAKSDLEALFALTGRENNFTFQSAEHSALHPSQTSAIFYRDIKIGYMGALHPALLQSLELAGPVYLFELDMSNLLTKELPRFKEFSKFPAIRRDISFLVDATISIQQILSVTRESASEWLVDLVVFDVYQGKNIEIGKRSLALGLILQHPDRTLVDKEIDEIMERVTTVLKQSFTIKLRD